MAMTVYTLTDANVGDVLPITGGFLVNLAKTSPPSPSYETPDASPAKQTFTSGYFTLRGSRDLQNLINVSPQSGGAATYWGSDANGLVTLRDQDRDEVPSGKFSSRRDCLALRGHRRGAEHAVRLS
jgi:hypothetical protein